jgi:hypothetical protein
MGAKGVAEGDPRGDLAGKSQMASRLQYIEAWT